MNPSINLNNITLTCASLEQADEIYQLMQTVYNQLDNKSLYVCDTPEYVKAHIEDMGFTVIASNEDSEMVACFMVRYPGQEEDNLGRDLGLNQEELNRVVHMESAVVLPEYRGRGLQRAMLKYAEERIDQSKYRYLMATVSPDNPHSYHSLEKSGYELKLTKEKYGGFMRRIYMKILTIHCSE